MAALRRVARTLGAAEGTGPDDDPLLAAERMEGRKEAQAEAVFSHELIQGYRVMYLYS